MVEGLLESHAITEAVWNDTTPLEAAILVQHPGMVRLRESCQYICNRFQWPNCTSICLSVWSHGSVSAVRVSILRRNV